ncbi:MAG: hypothetical protein IIB27_04465 [Chloroflexi bacterium]|nr:hypothetical protein [Chloroflexota bacterium]
MSADTLTIHRVWMGLQSWRSAFQDRLITFQGPSAYARDFPDWFLLNHFSNVPMPVAAGRPVLPGCDPYRDGLLWPGTDRRVTAIS